MAKQLPADPIVDKFIGDTLEEIKMVNNTLLNIQNTLAIVVANTSATTELLRVIAQRLSKGLLG